MILQYFILCFVFVQLFKYVLFNIKTKVKNNILKIFLSKTYCLKCLGLWLTLICTLDIFVATSVSMLGIIYEYIIEPILIKIKKKYDL